MQQRILKLAILATMGLAPVAFAGVVTSGLPPIKGFPTEPTKASTATAATASADTSADTNSHVTTADQVPAIQSGAAAKAKTTPPSPAQVFQQMTATPPEGPISKRTKELMGQSLRASGAAIKSLPVHAGRAGSIEASANGRPVLVCSPLHTCVIALPAGSKPAVTVGISKAEWSIEQAVVGKVPEIFLSPKFAGLHQNLVVAATLNGATQNYQIRLVSDKTQYIPVLQLQSQNTSVRTWADSRSWADLSAKKPKTPKVLPLPNVHLNHINKDWKISCGGGGWFSNSDCAPIKPLRVFDDGKRTYIEMPAGLGNHGGFPILQAKDKSGQLIGVNSQIRGNEMVVDSVPPEIVLRLGKEVVDIKHLGGE
ncbi:MAG: TrbG/VirB9 family P-type conjugative transfer protein [Acidithiobacillus sp.]|nr:TrbG/VirB9 family P-type conjugative transfer protein [Acidithiobacillus sp.]